MRRRLAVLALGAGVWAAPAVGQSSVPYVAVLPASVRAAGLNGAAVALVGDAGAVFTNPAGLATVSHIALEGAYRTAPGGAALATGAAAWRLRQFDLGAGVREFRFGADPGAYLGAAAAPGAAARERLGAASLVYRFGLIALGVTGKYATRAVATGETRAVSGDAGVAVAFFDIMALAFAVQNLGGNWDDTSSLALPRVSRFGFTMNYVDPQETFRLLSTFELEWAAGRHARGVIGGEAGIVWHGVGFVGRLGYAGRGTAYAATPLALGLTVTIGPLDVDYAHRATDLLGRPAHMVGGRLTL